MNFAIRTSRLRRAILVLTERPARPGANQDDPLGVAVAHLAGGDRAAAFDHLKRLADEGDPHAARIALMLAAHGRRVLGGSYVVADAQRRKWTTTIEPPKEVNETPSERPIRRERPAAPAWISRMIGNP